MSKSTSHANKSTLRTQSFKLASVLKTISKITQAQGLKTFERAVILSHAEVEPILSSTRIPEKLRKTLEQIPPEKVKLLIIMTKNGYTCFILRAQNAALDEIPFGCVIFPTGEYIVYDKNNNEQRGWSKMIYLNQTDEDQVQDQSDEALIKRFGKAIFWFPKQVRRIVYQSLGPQFVPQEIVVQDLRKITVCPAISEALRANPKFTKALVLLPDEADFYLDALKRINHRLSSKIREHLRDGKKQLVVFIDQNEHLDFYFLKPTEPFEPSDMLSLVVFPDGEFQSF